MVSVIIPTYQRYEMLKTAVNSVLQQTYQNLEIIVIDDCSNDDTARIKNLSSKITYLCNDKNYGPGYSRRQGLLCCNGDYVVFLDDDDYYTDPNFFSTAVGVLKTTQDCVFVSANAVVLYEDNGTQVDEKLNTVGEMNASTYLEGFPFKYKKPHSTFTSVFRKSALLEAGIDKMKMVNDMPIYMRCSTARGTIVFLEDTIGVYRIHNSNISNAMTWEFIRSNLEEKYSVRLVIEQGSLFDDISTWWLKQLETTIGYFVYGSQPSIKEWYAAREWCIEHSSNKDEIERLFRKYRDYLIDVRICAVKQKIKKALGMK